MPGRKNLPDTVRRSSRRAQDTWSCAHDSAVDTYGEGERADRVAYAALKRTFEESGGRWKVKEARGGSGARAAGPRAPRGSGVRGTAGGADAGVGKEYLYARARELDVPGRSTMTKAELVEALEKAGRPRKRRPRAS
ncbi:ChaB family protein [Nocardiopsis mangrovi]|uniref:ChaB family protein n=1 Tax=Nocardiopsis mangrovi TaxID=1179818 RepID=A0ABV9E0J0_9ACTN